MKFEDNLSPYTSYVESSAPSSPSAGNQRVYIDSADHHIKLKNSSGTVTDLQSTGGTTTNSVCNGRLTLTTALPVTTSDVTAATTLYFTPYAGNQIATYSGSAWTLSTFAEKSITLATLTADLPYDCYIVDSTLALELLAWTNATTRATGLVLQDGVLVKSGATTRRYLGTICITGSTGQCEDSVTKRLVWNYYNRRLRPLHVFDGTDSWTYGTATWRAANNTATNHQLKYMDGYSEDIISCEVRCTSTAASSAGAVGIGIDSTSANSAQQYNEQRSLVSGLTQARYRGFPGVGAHTLTWLEYVRTGTHTFEGDDGVADQQSGITAELWG